jgi:hypothetical protein
MDRDQLLEDLRKSFPIYASVLSSILSIGAFILSLNKIALFWTMVVSVLLTSLISFSLLWIARYKSYSRRLQDFVVLDSDDICEIIDPQGKEANYKRRIKFEAKRSAPIYITYPAEVEGEQDNFTAYECSKPSARYNVSVQRSGGRRVLFVNLGRTLQKNEVVEGLCVEWKAINSFMSENEAVTVTSEPGQQSSTIKVILPAKRPPCASEWFVTYSKNPLPLYRGIIDIEEVEGKHVLFHNFSQYLTTTVELRFTIAWRYS